MYDWREMTNQERRSVLEQRIAQGASWHSPPHLDLAGEHIYLISAACYEHRKIVGQNIDRMATCAQALLLICKETDASCYAWSLLPNHYHLLIRTEQIKLLRSALGLYHGRSSRWWNLEDNQVGRKVWHNCFERPMKSERHFYASLNYVHHNPVKHGYVEKWQEWPFSSAVEFLEQVGRERAAAIWRAYPILDYGEKWDL